MTAKHEWLWDGNTAEAEFASSILPSDPVMAELFRFVDLLHARVPLASFVVQLREDGDYDYNFEAKDGRTWTQVLRVPPGQPANQTSMTFDVPDFWKVAEFSTHRELRDRVTALIVSHALTSLEVTWQ